MSTWPDDFLFATRSLLEAGTIRADRRHQRAALRRACRRCRPSPRRVPGYEVTFWGGLMAPRGTPEPILDR